MIDKEPRVEHWADYARFTTAVLVILNPLGAIPIFLGLTSGQSRRRRHQTAAAAAVTVGCVLAASLLAGEWVLRSFGINVPCFQVGGGILILLMAISMLHAKSSRIQQTPGERRAAEEQESVGVVPLGTPLLAGPGSISTAIIYANKARTWLDMGFLLSICALAALCVWIVLRLAPSIGALLGRTGINIMTRLMGLVLAALAIKFITDGLVQLLPGLTAK
jgi:multiple antibiotic resistance protein